MNEIVLSLFTGLARLPVALRTEPPLLLMTRKAGRTPLLAAGPAGARGARLHCLVLLSDSHPGLIPVPVPGPWHVHKGRCRCRSLTLQLLR